MFLAQSGFSDDGAVVAIPATAWTDGTGREKVTLCDVNKSKQLVSLRFDEKGVVMALGISVDGTWVAALHTGPGPTAPDTRDVLRRSRRVQVSEPTAKLHVWKELDPAFVAAFPDAGHSPCFAFSPDASRLA